MPQILWPEVKEFIWDRFRRYRNQKSGHLQWDEVGKGLWDLATMRDPNTGRDVTQERSPSYFRSLGRRRYRSIFHGLMTDVRYCPEWLLG